MPGTTARQSRRDSAVDFTGGKADVSTLGDVLNVINNAQQRGLRRAADRAARHSGQWPRVSRQLDRCRDISVSGGTRSVTAIDLGLFPDGQTTQCPAGDLGRQPDFDRSRHESRRSHGLFTALIRLKDAIGARATTTPFNVACPARRSGGSLDRGVAMSVCAAKRLMCIKRS